MEIKHIYIAADGEEFDTAEECLSYENRQEDCSGIVAFDSKLMPLSGAQAFAESGMYYFIKDEEEAQRTFELFDEYYVITVPRSFSTGDIVKYDEDIDDYSNLVNHYAVISSDICTIIEELKARYDVPAEALGVLEDQLIHCANKIRAAIGMEV